MKLKIELNLKGTTISGRVLEQDESLRNTNSKPITLIQNDEFRIVSSTLPLLGWDELFVRGMSYNDDNHIFLRSFETIEEVENIYKNIIELVNKLNGALGGVVDERGNILFTKGDTIGIIHNQGDWESLKTGVDKDQSAKADKGKLELSLVNPQPVKAVAEESGLSHLAHMACNISFLLNKEYLKEHESEV